MQVCIIFCVKAAKIFHQKLHLLVNSEYTVFQYHLKIICVCYLSQQSWSLAFLCLADVDRFKICTQDCVLPGFWPLFPGTLYK